MASIIELHWVDIRWKKNKKKNISILRCWRWWWWTFDIGLRGFAIMIFGCVFLTLWIQLQFRSIKLMLFIVDINVPHKLYSIQYVVCKFSTNGCRFTEHGENAGWWIFMKCLVYVNIFRVLIKGDKFHKVGKLNENFDWEHFFLLLILIFYVD